MAPSTTVRRLLRETLELSASSPNPNPSFHAHPVSDEDLFEWHFTLLGPPSPSPYAGGLYHGRISLPLTYPLKPPNFRFLTPSGRFEVNREICLSISGFHEESWMPAWGIRTALVALRTFMGEEGTAGQVGGMEASKDVRQRMARSSRDWRCEGCGGRTNDEIMREWWGICKEKGTQVEEEAGLEDLPEGLKLGFKDQIGKGEKKAVSEKGSTTRVFEEDRNMNEKGRPMTSEKMSSAAIGNTAGSYESSTSSKRIQYPSSAAGEASGENSSSSTAEQSTESAVRAAKPTPTSSTPSRPTAAHYVPTTAAEQQPNTATPLLDKAISGLVLALLFMVLKKVLYNPNVTTYDT